MKILMCTPVNETPLIFEHHLRHARKLSIPRGYKIHRHYILHNCDHLKILLDDYETYEIKNDDTKYTKTDKTHEWRIENFSAVVEMKNSLIQKAITEKYDYIFFCDSDIVLHPMTVADLLSEQKDMISATFWTRWEPDQPPMPNVWDFDHYQITKETLQNLIERKTTHKVGMTGACTLISYKMLEAGVNWSPITNVSMTAWEDRAFCIRANVLGFDIYTSTKCEPLHLYRQSIVDNFETKGADYEQIYNDRRSLY